MKAEQWPQRGLSPAEHKENSCLVAHLSGCSPNMPKQGLGRTEPNPLVPDPGGQSYGPGKQLKKLLENPQGYLRTLKGS